MGAQLAPAGRRQDIRAMTGEPTPDTRVGEPTPRPELPQPRGNDIPRAPSKHGPDAHAPGPWSPARSLSAAWKPPGSSRRPAGPAPSR
jgi:hypothetical protein